jgi:TolB-like protein/DNA-binding winged helix-turn-helix (wHTH) protein/Tfp pilus assembly protein PilF
VDPGANTISGPEAERQIEPKAMHVLCVLASQPGQTVRRETLLETIWAGRIVVDETLTRSVSLLRQAFQSVAGQSGYIQTVPKQGYRLTAPVGEVAPEPPKADETAPPVRLESRQRLLLGLTGGVLMVLLVVGIAYWASPTGDDSQRATSISSVAVLPFEQLDESDETAYLAAGVAEELINALAGVPDLRVPSRHSSFAFDDHMGSLADIAAKLDVRHVLEGSVRRSGEAIRINARLIDVASDSTLWSRQYQGQLSDVFAMEEEIASGVIAALQGMPDDGDLGDRLTRTPSIDAYSAYLQGQYWWMNGTTGNWFYQARDAFEEAIALDPKFAEAHASLAYIYARHDFHDRYMPRDEARRKSLIAIERALSLDSEAVNAHLARAMLATASNDFATARTALDTALGIEPNNPVTHYIESELQLALNQPDAALRSAERALALDPLSAWVNVNLGIVHYYRGEYVAAVKAVDEAIRIDPEYTWAHVWKATIRHAQGQLADAVISLKECLSLDPASESNAVLLGYLYLDLMDVSNARHWFEYAASLRGDTGSARLWRRVVDLVYGREDDEMLIALANKAGDEIHNARYSLLPVLYSAFVAQGRKAEAYPLLVAAMSGGGDGVVHVQPKDAAVALSLVGTDEASSELSAAIMKAIAAYPAFYQQQGLTALWYAHQGQAEPAINSLADALEVGWLTHWWMLPQLPAFDEQVGTKDFEAILASAESHAKEEAEKLAALVE